MLSRAYLVPFFFKLFLRTTFENTKNIILVFSENCSCSLNLVFSMFSVFFRTKEMGTKRVLCVFLVLLIFQNKIQFSKTVNKQALIPPSLYNRLEIVSSFPSSLARSSCG